MNNAATETDQNNKLSIFNADTARNLLTALARPRNNHIELFQKPIQINVKDIESLTSKIVSKLEQLRVDPKCTLMKTLVSFDKDRSFQLIGWQQFKEFDWRISERTNAITLTWEFFYQKDGDNNPELHIMSVRITEAMNPMQYLRAALSNNRDDVEQIEIKMAPIVCEVDYVDGLLSRELIHLVSEWHKALRSRPS